MSSPRYGLPVFLILSLFFCGFRGGKNPAPKAVRVRTLIIDPGHCNTNSGTKGLISTEQEVTLAVALKLGEAVKKNFPQMKTVFTRTSMDCADNATNLKDDLNARARIANQAKGDLFVSIHCNSSGKPPGGYYEKRVIGHQRKLQYVGRGRNRRKKYVNAPIFKSYWVKNMRVGTETLIWKASRLGSKTDAISEFGDEGGENAEPVDPADSAADDSTHALTKEQHQAEAEAFDVSSPEAKMRAQLYEKRFFDNSALFATMVEEGFAGQGRQSGGVYQRDKGIRVLEATGMPSVLIEIGFLSNKEEEEYLNSAKGEDEIVENIINALKRYTGAPDAVIPVRVTRPDTAETIEPVDSAR